MPKIFEFVKLNTIKRYIKTVIGKKASTTAVEQLLSYTNEIVRNTIKEADQLAKKERKKTILTRYMEIAIENKFQKRQLTAKEIFAQLIGLKSSELGELVLKVKDYVQEQKSAK